MVAANRVAAIIPPYRRYGPDTEIQYRPRKPHRLAKPSRILSKREADTEFQHRPHTVDTDTIADAVFADAISETSNININKFAGLSRDWVGGKILFMRFAGSFLQGEKENKHNPFNNPGTIQ